MASGERHPAGRAAGRRAGTAEDRAVAVPPRERAGKLPGQLPEVVEHPLFRDGYRRGYEAGYRDHADEERRAELEEAAARLVSRVIEDSSTRAAHLRRGIIDNPRR
jgi:hypothetical protein